MPTTYHLVPNPSMFPRPIQHLIDLMTRLPGVGPKTAERFVFFLLRQDEATLNEFSRAFGELKKGTTRCSTCYQHTDDNPCAICANTGRDQTMLCVVADTQDVAVIELSGEFKGRYHVLGGVLSPIEGTTPDQLTLKELKNRVEGDGITEVIIATDPTVEGEATALYIKRLLDGINVRLTRIARGLPMGSDIEYADPATLANALEGRREM